MNMTKDMAEAALDQGVLNVRFDPRFPGVQVPEHLRTGPDLILKFSTFYDAPIDLTEDYIAQELGFQGRSYPCHVPLAAVEQFRVDEHDFQPAPVPKRPRLRLVGDEDD